MKQLTSLMLIAMLTLGLSACEEDGPMEDLGEDVDEAVTDAGNAVEDACEDVKDAADAENQNC